MKLTVKLHILAIVYADMNASVHYTIPTNQTLFSEHAIHDCDTISMYSMQHALNTNMALNSTHLPDMQSNYQWFLLNSGKEAQQMKKLPI